MKFNNIILSKNTILLTTNNGLWTKSISNITNSGFTKNTTIPYYSKWQSGKNNIDLIKVINGKTYVGVDTDGSDMKLFSSSDNHNFTLSGTAWNSKTDIYRNPAMNKVTSFGSTIYWTTEDGLYTSNNNGKSFTKTTLKVNYQGKKQEVKRILWIKKIKNLILIQTDGGVFQSTDGISFSQNHWLPMLFLGNVYDINNNIYVTTVGQGLWMNKNKFWA